MRGLTLLFLAVFAASTHAQRQHDSSNPDETKLLISEEQRRLIKKGRDDQYMPPEGKKVLDAILQAPNHSAFEREKVVGEVSYQQPSGWDGKSSLQRSRPDKNKEDLRSRYENSKRISEIGEPMSALEAGARTGSRRALGGSPEDQKFSSLRDGAPVMVPTEKKIAYRNSERKARKRLLEGEGSDALSALARSQIGQGKFTDARDAADKALGINPENAEAYALRAIASEALGDEQSKMAALRQAARINPTRFEGLLKEAQRGMRLFDPSTADSWHLLDALAEEQTPSTGPSRKNVALFILALLVFGIPLGAGMALYRRLSPEQQRKAVSWWRTASRGQVLPQIGTSSIDRIRKPEGASIVSLEPGLRIADKYKLVRRLGVDGTVEVWKAHDTVLDRPVLMKRLYESRTNSEEWNRRLADSKKAAALHHPNITDLYEILDMPIGLYVVYEYPSGKTVRDVIDGVGPIPLLQAIDILIPVCRALQHAHHREIVHGGLSPERIVLTRQGYIKVTDFVVARTTASGAEAYVAPEAKRGDPTRASDIYSLGACLHELLTGATPGLEGEAQPDPRAEELLGRALDLDERTRIQSARVFQKELEALKGAIKPEASDSDQDDGSRSETTA
ncbi:MAG: hypothetical protein COB53_04255 [Elusimicrobia bacterium]|nr:MAG: hypothetical protein COB53_04255 [Elusimicrobiota bacterium]